ncbi:MAG: GGDEF domain-containing protein [Eubacterium sp.]|nr:GGDEF domain-containing protein [Eubacterium sp.]
MERKKVAVFLANIYRDMTKETEYGVINAAEKNNIKLILFTSFNDNYSSNKYARYKNYDKGDMSIFHLSLLSEYDGLISFDSYMPDLYRERVNDIKRQFPGPIVSLGDTTDFSYNIVNDQDSSFMEVIEHLINVHGCRDFVYVSSKRDRPFLRDRERITEAVMQKHGIPFPPEKTVYGTMKSNCGEAVASQILDLYKDKNRPLPEAIICVNDYTALGIIKALQNRGFNIPDDVLITGYDDVLQARYSEPSITSSRQPFENVGKAGIETLVDLWNGENVPNTQELPGILKLRESCGCESNDTFKYSQLRDAYDILNEKQDDLSLSATNLLLGTYASETLEDVFNEIEDNCLNETGFNDAVLCLAKDWNGKRIINSVKDLEDVEFDVVCGMYNNKPIPRQTLAKGCLLPDVMMDDSKPYYIFPIHYIQYFMGYFIVSPNLEDIGQLNIKSWLVNIGTILFNWYTRYELKTVVEKMRDLSNRDMLTGLFNRRGYDLFFGDYYNECIENRSNLAVFAIDMDDMKHINDTYGHPEGDYCLKTIATCLTKASKHNEICIRSGGDEFVIIAKNYTDEMARKYIAKVRKYISEQCRQDGKEYNIVLSFGYEITAPKETDDDQFNKIKESYLRVADQKMYEEKREHHHQ